MRPRRQRRLEGAGGFKHYRSVPKRGVENSSHHMASARNIIGGGNNNVLADPQVAQQTAYLDGCPAVVRHVTHHDK